MAERVRHRVQCAAITRGCPNYLVWEDGSVEQFPYMLLINDWRLDHGRWICPHHGGFDVADPPKPE